MATIAIEIKGFDELLNRAILLESWKTGLHEQIADLVKRQHEHRLEVEKQSPPGRPWAPLKPATILKKKSKGCLNPEEILMDTGRMASSWRVTTKGDLIRLRNVAEDRCKRYIWFHQVGTLNSDGSVRMEKREVMGHSRPGILEIRRSIERHIGRVLEGGLHVGP